ncbi:MAG: hypothetical protein R3E62_10315 [Pseudomonadales bacterium]
MEFSINRKKWILFPSFMFGVLGIFSLVITDLVFLPSAQPHSSKLYFSVEPTLLFSASVMPFGFAYFAANKWLHKNSSFFRGWFSVAGFAWLALILNPIIWLLVLATFTLFGFVVLFIFLTGGLILQLIWKISGGSACA